MTNAYINVTDGVKRVMGKTTLYKKLLGMITTSDAFSRFKDAYNQKDLTTCSNIAHEIKGMSGNLALTLLFETSNKIMLKTKTEMITVEEFFEFESIWVKTLDVINETVSTLV